MKRTLLDLGFENVIEAVDGVDALEKLHVGDVEFIICDWHMPKMMGIDLLRAVRADGKFCQMPFLMVTAEVKRENIIAAARAGVSNYIAKPFTVESLQEKIQEILNR